MSKLIREFLVQGSETLPYKVVFMRNGSQLIATCSCKAGVVGQLCKHRLSILRGDTTAVVSNSAAEVAEVASWLVSSEVAPALFEITSLEEQKKQIDLKIKRAKKLLAEVLLQKPSNS